MAGLIEIKANSASLQSWSWGLAELGKNEFSEYFRIISLSTKEKNFPTFQNPENTYLMQTKTQIHPTLYPTVNIDSLANNNI